MSRRTVTITDSAARHDLLVGAFRGELRWSEAIFRMRRSLGKTQEEFGRMFGLSRRKVIDLEAGRGNPELRTLARIGRPFGLMVGFVPDKDLKPPLD